MMKVNKMKLGENLYRVLGERQMTQTDLAAKCGLDRSHINAYINSRCLPSVVNLAKMSRALGVSMDELAKGVLSEEEKKNRL